MTMLLDGSNGGTFPSWTTSTRPASPTVGQLGYNTTTGNYDMYTASGWTTPVNSTTGKVLASQMPTGSVLQVVQGSTSSTVTTTGTTLIDTNLTATITPLFSTSKILVTTYEPETGRQFNAGPIQLALLRNSTTISYVYRFALIDATTPSGFQTQAFSILDAPATTSAVTYKVQFALTGSGGTAYHNVDGSLATITLMEIAA